VERDLLLTALVAEVLGPRGGPQELLGPQEDPCEEYLTGVLAPHRSASVDIDADAELAGEAAVRADDQADPGASVLAPAPADHLVCPALDPRARPSSLGVSFTLTAAKGPPAMDVCCTWARYARHSSGGWQREPRGHLWTAVAITGAPLSRRFPEDSGVEIQVRSRHEPSGWRVTVFLINVTPAAGNRPVTEEHLFQPQIRIRRHHATDLVRLDEGRSATSDEDQFLAMLYNGRPSFARGHLCAAVWAGLDPERPHPSLPPITSAPYWWADGDAVFGSAVRAQFSPADVRSVYVPVVQVQAPDRGWDPALAPPALDPAVLAEAWGPGQAQAALLPLTVAYESWLRLRDAEVPTLPASQQPVARAALTRCRQALGDGGGLLGFCGRGGEGHHAPVGTGVAP
jgi:hypothetical protein